jgi:hypothetical protein
MQSILEHNPQHNRIEEQLQKTKKDKEVLLKYGYRK